MPYRIQLTAAAIVMGIIALGLLEAQGPEVYLALPIIRVMVGVLIALALIEIWTAKDQDE